MEVKHSPEVDEMPVEGVPGVTVRWLWSATDGAPTFALRFFEVEPGAATPYHSHAHEHEVYVLSGQGRLRGKSQGHALGPDDTALVLPYEKHQFVNTGTDLLRFLCGIPLQGEPMGLTAQVSLYPLRQPELAPAIDEALEIFRQYHLEVMPGPMSTLVSGDSVNLFKALQRAFQNAAKEGEVVMVTTFSNACPVPGEVVSEGLSFQAIGYVENEFAEPTDPDTLSDSISRIVINADLSEGLAGLTPGDKALVVFYFHRSEEYELLQHPRGDQTRSLRGVFALRSPHRPNPIGVTEIELLEVDNNVLTVRGLDALDGTPVIDLKPA
jgi:tRNA-Thr(GGU) m(6)t(6)A37 methyltransferase TsaA